MLILRFSEKSWMLAGLSVRFPVLTGAFLAAFIAVAAGSPQVEGEVLVTFRQDVPEVTVRESINRRALRLTKNYDRITWRQRKFTGLVRDPSRTTAELMAELKKDPTVESVEPNFYRRAQILRPDDTHYSRLWGHENTGQTVNGTAGVSGTDTRFHQAWNLARTTGTEPVVAVIDTGAYVQHPDLAGNLWTNPLEIPGNGIDDDGNGYVDDVNGYDFSMNSGAMFDSGSHGTHIAGTIAATGKNAKGIIGLQYRSKVLPLKVSTDGTWFEGSHIVEACNYIVTLKQRGVNIVAVNGSYGDRVDSPVERNAIAALGDVGIVFCAAAGNNGTDNNNASLPFYPANYDVDNLISVAALNQTNGLAGFSNYGATSVDLAAPGVNVYSTYPLTMLGRTSSVTIGATSYPCSNITYSGLTPLSGITRPVISCGSGLTAADFPPAVSGNIALIQRGTNFFADKTTLAKAAGAVGVIIYNNVVDNITWTMLAAAPDWLPAVQISKADGEAILASLPASGTLVNHADPDQAYAYFQGTSMASPHVAAAIAFAAWNFPGDTMQQRIERVLNNTTAVAALTGKVAKGGRLDLLKMIDTDIDGLPDWWETERFGNLARTASEDPDGDGFANLAEFLGGTSPTSGASRLEFTSASPVTDISGPTFVMAFPTVAERVYQIQWNESLTGAWTNLGSTIIGTGSPFQTADAITGVPRRFYRLKLIE